MSRLAEIRSQWCNALCSTLHCSVVVHVIHGERRISNLERLEAIIDNSYSVEAYRFLSSLLGEKLLQETLSLVCPFSLFVVLTPCPHLFLCFVALVGAVRSSRVRTKRTGERASKQASEKTSVRVSE